MPTDRRIDRARERVGMPLNHRVIDLLDRALLEGALEVRVGGLGLGDDHQAARADVEPVHHALTLGRTAGRDPEAGGRQRTHHRRPLPTEGGMGRNTGRLVDHDDVVIIEDDPEFGHRDRNDLRTFRGLPFDLEPAPTAQPVGLVEGHAVEAHAARRRDLRSEGSRETEHLRESGVDARALEAVGHRQ